MEPTIIAALIKAGVNLVALFVESWSKSPPGDKEQKKVEGWLADPGNYESLSKMITKNSVKLLLAAEYGKGFRIDEFREVLHPKLGLSPKEKPVFDLEFHYRLEYMRLLGVLTIGMREYRITRLGKAFLAKARANKDYASVLSPY